jgi:putative transposase
MPRRQWEANTTALLVIEGLQGKPVAELGTEHQSSQAQSYQWRDQFLAQAPKALEVHEQRQREARLVRENASLKTLVAQRHEGLLQRIRELKAEPPRWGYRRIWAHLHGVERRSTRCACGVGGEHTASCCPPSCASQPSGPRGRATPNRPRPMNGGASIGPRACSEALGWSPSSWRSMGRPTPSSGMMPGCGAPHGLLALDMAVNRQFPAGGQGKGLSMMRDNGCQPTSTTFMRACGTLGPVGLDQLSHPRGHADTERVIRTLKEACLWRHEWPCP